jgi:NADPH-dependent 2,4-dienoyl-CoA reductase/sulfur reductase-like enzyme
LSVANQIYDRFKAAGKPINAGDIAIIDASENHFYQPGWTLVGSGLRKKTEFRKPLASLIPSHITHVVENVKTFKPDSSSLVTSTGRTLSYDALVVAAGLQINWDAIKGLPEALADPSSGVKSIYSYDTCDQVWSNIEALKGGKAVFTQPIGVIKCPGAPQKIMWMAWSRFDRTSRGNDISIDFYNGMPTMFSVKKYSDALEALRLERKIGGHFQHSLTSIDAANRKATFLKADKSTVEVDYDFLHAVPPMGPLEFLKTAPISDAAGWVDVNPASLRHNKPEYGNIFALGDCSSLPTSRTAAAITAQAPVVAENLYSVLDSGKVNPNAIYDGYTSCPLLTGHGELMLTEFKYGFIPKESFSAFFDQSKSRRLFYHLKKDLFPWAYWNHMIKGNWFGSSAFRKPSF